jgi:hypothetical protein
MIHLRFLCPAAVLTLALGPIPAFGSVILSNLDGNDLTSTALADASRSKAMGFQVGATSQIIDFVTLRLQVTDFASANLDVALFDDNGSGSPGTSLMTFDNPVLSSDGTANFNFDAPVNLELTSGEVYWIVVRNLNTSSVRWMASNPAVSPTDPTPSTIDATHFGTKFSIPDYPPTGASGILTSYSITAVPEPVRGIVGVAISLSALAMGRHWHRRRSLS